MSAKRPIFYPSKTLYHICGNPVNILWKSPAFGSPPFDPIPFLIPPSKEKRIAEQEFDFLWKTKTFIDGKTAQIKISAIIEVHPIGPGIHDV